VDHLVGIIADSDIFRFVVNEGHDKDQTTILLVFYRDTISATPATVIIKPNK